MGEYAKNKRLALLLTLLLGTTLQYAVQADEDDDAPVRPPLPRKRLYARALPSARLEEKAIPLRDNTGRPLTGPHAPLGVVMGEAVQITLPVPSPVPHPLQTDAVFVDRFGAETPLRIQLSEATQPGTLPVTIILPKQIAAGDLVITVRTRGRVLTQWKRTLYLLYDLPNAPQTEPWIGVLDDACRWAYGAQSQDDIAARLTLGLFQSKRFTYPVADPRQDSHWVFGTAFHLSAMLAQQPGVSGNCTDVSDYLAICANALGLSFEVIQLTGPVGTRMQTNPICPIGWDAADWTNYRSLPMEMHQVSVPKGTREVYDACFAQWVDENGSPYAQPPLKWSLDANPGYWQSWFGGVGLIHTPTDCSLQLSQGAYVPTIY